MLQANVYNIATYMDSRHQPKAQAGCRQQQVTADILNAASDMRNKSSVHSTCGNPWCLLSCVQRDGSHSWSCG